MSHFSPLLVLKALLISPNAALSIKKNKASIGDESTFLRIPLGSHRLKNEPLGKCQQSAVSSAVVNEEVIENYHQ